MPSGSPLRVRAPKTYLLNFIDLSRSSNSFGYPSIVITTTSGLSDSTASSYGLVIKPIFVFYLSLLWIIAKRRDANEVAPPNPSTNSMSAMIGVRDTIRSGGDA